MFFTFKSRYFACFALWSHLPSRFLQNCEAILLLGIIAVSMGHKPLIRCQSPETQLPKKFGGISVSWYWIDEIAS